MELVKQNLYQTLILWHPTKEQAKTGQKSKIIGEIKTFLEAGDKEAGMKVIKSIPDEYNDELDQIEVVVKPF